jgi:hypothetical protein
MKFNCFYKVKVTQNGKTEVWHWGYFPYSMVLKDVKTLYKEGADAVVLEMITEKQFNNAPNPNLTDREVKEILKT